MAWMREVDEIAMLRKQLAECQQERDELVIECGFYEAINKLGAEKTVEK